MSPVLNFLDFKERRETPIFVLADLHLGILSNDDLLTAELKDMLENCRAALDHARAIALPVAFLRQTAPTRSLLETRPYPAWLKGFEPRRSEMVFDRPMPSCYTSQEFSKMIEQWSGGFVIAGLASEMSCVSTMVDAFHRHHQATYLSDASYCGSKRYFSSEEMRRGVSAVLSLYGAISTTSAWISFSTRTANAVA